MAGLAAAMRAAPLFVPTGIRTGGIQLPSNSNSRSSPLSFRHVDPSLCVGHDRPCGVISPSIALALPISIFRATSFIAISGVTLR